MPSTFSSEYLVLIIVLAVVGLLTASLRKVPAKIFEFIARQLTVTVHIDSNDRLFECMKLWFHLSPHARRSRLVSASLVPAGGSDKHRWRLILSPAPGLHVMLYQRRLLLLHRDRKDMPMLGAGMAVRENLILHFLTRSTAIAESFLAMVERAAIDDSDSQVSVFTADLFQNWYTIATQSARDLDSVILANDQLESLLEDLDTFLDSESWYRSMSIPYHRGYLFYGPPGNGKTSLAMALAGEHKMDIYILNVNTLNDTRLAILLAGVPSRSVLLFEDIDGVFTGRETPGKVTFSGFLNALDGINAKDGIIVFMSTNHVERLDPALIRPGRIDMQVFLGNATEDQARKLFLRFFPGKELEAALFGAAGCAHQASMATLQEYLLRRRFSLEEVMHDLPTLAPTTRSRVAA